MFVAISISASAVALLAASAGTHPAVVISPCAFVGSSPQTAALIFSASSLSRSKPCCSIFGSDSRFDRTALWICASAGSP